MTEKIAYIREAECIGCIKCISACSDQAIIGARKLMHTIITDLCTGCEDCIAVCPVDCIEMINKPIQTELNHLSNMQKNTGGTARVYVQAAHSLHAKKASIAAAIARTQAKRAWAQGSQNDTTDLPRDL